MLKNDDDNKKMLEIVAGLEQPISKIAKYYKVEGDKALYKYFKQIRVSLQEWIVLLGGEVKTTKSGADSEGDNE